MSMFQELEGLSRGGFTTELWPRKRLVFRRGRAVLGLHSNADSHQSSEGHDLLDRSKRSRMPLIDVLRSSITEREVQQMFKKPLHRVFAVAIAVIFVCFIAYQNLYPVLRNGKSSATITASPNPVPPGGGFGASTITWNTGDGTVGEVYVAQGDNLEKLFASGRSQGSLEAPWIGAGAPYEFRLYAGKEHKNRLASVKVVRAEK